MVTAVSSGLVFASECTILQKMEFVLAFDHQIILAAKVIFRNVPLNFLLVYMYGSHRLWCREKSIVSLCRKHYFLRMVLSILTHGMVTRELFLEMWKLLEQENR